MEEINLTVENDELNVEVVGINRNTAVARLAHALLMVAQPKFTREEIIEIVGLAYDTFKDEEDKDD